MKKFFFAAVFFAVVFFVSAPAFADEALVGEWQWSEEFGGEDGNPRYNDIYLSIRPDGTLTLDPDFFNWFPDTVHANYEADGSKLRITTTELEVYTDHSGPDEFEMGKTTVCAYKIADGKLELDVYGQTRVFVRTR